MDRTFKFPVTYSLVSSKAIEDELIPLYNLPRTSSVLFIHQGINDTYLISTSEGKYILRIYRANWKSLTDVTAELDLLLLLNDNGLPVSYPLPDKSGNFIQRIDCPEGIRFAVLFCHAPGGSLPSLNDQNADLFGQYVGRLHNITEDLKLSGLSREYTPVEILRNTKRALQLLVANNEEAYEIAQNLFHRLEEKLNGELLRSVRSGICHGDLHHQNIFWEVSTEKITLFDFDFCGHGYLTYDLGCFLRYERDSPGNIVNFLNGYEKVRPLNQSEKACLPYFEVLMRVFHLGARGMNADGLKNSKWLNSDMVNTICDIDMQLSKI
jgi:Ser/Thr protein kinase RdoA (MazF antagonist)